MQDEGKSKKPEQPKPDGVKQPGSIDKKSLFRGTGTRPPACACPHADRLEPV